MKQTCLVLVISFVQAFSSFSQATAAWERVWEINNLPNPESVVFDATRGVIFVSHQAYGAKPGSGSIGKLSLDGKIVAKEWVDGLTEPKGIAILGDKLFVSDVTALIEIDISSGKITRKYKGEGAKFLNDVAISTAGYVYVSDMFNSSIYKLDQNKKLKVWLVSPLLENPNGLLVQGGKILVSAWGRFSNEKPLTAEKGNLLSVDIASKKISKLSKSPIGHLDGIQPFEQNQFLISDWVSGDLFLVDRNFQSNKLMNLGQSLGDIAFIADKNLLLIPNAKQGKVLAYKRK